MFHIETPQTLNSLNVGHKYVNEYYENGFTQFFALRIDNSRHGRMHSLWNISRTTKATSCDISNERADFSACVDIYGF